MRASRDKALQYVFNDEGGFLANPDEPGGAVNMGVTLTALDRWRKSQGHDRPSVDDLKALTPAEATEMYVAHYWNPIRGDELPVGLDYAMFNTAVMNGVAGAIELLQEALGLGVTGRLGPEVWAALKTADVSDTVSTMLVAQMAAKMENVKVAKYGRGWGRRIKRVWARAKVMK